MLLRCKHYDKHESDHWYLNRLSFSRLLVWECAFICYDGGAAKANVVVVVLIAFPCHTV